jgi:hypothetical protein
MEALVSVCVCARARVLPIGPLLRSGQRGNGWLRTEQWIQQWGAVFSVRSVPRCYK